MSTPTDADRVTLHIAGHVHADWLKYSIDSDFFTPADGWSVSLGTPAAALPEYLQPWAEVQIRVGDDLVMSGRVDRVRHAFRKGEHILDIRGRDGAAVLLDCSAPIFVSREVTLSEAVAAVARPLGIAKLDIAGRDAAFVKVTIEPGMSAWEVIQQAAEASGLWPWFTPDGTLKIAAPDYTTPPVAALIMRLDGKGNNVIDLEIDKGCERRYSEVTVLAQGAGTEKKKGKNAMKGKATDPNVKWYRPLIVSEGCLDSPGDALKKSKKRIADGVMDSFTITAKVRGHRTSDGKLWEPGQRVTLNDGEHVYFLTRRTFNGGRDGTTTTLVLKPDGVWLPDTSKKGKRGKKGRKAFSGSWDFGDET